MSDFQESERLITFNIICNAPRPLFPNCLNGADAWGAGWSRFPRSRSPRRLPGLFQRQLRNNETMVKDRRRMRCHRETFLRNGGDLGEMGDSWNRMICWRKINDNKLLACSPHSFLRGNFIFCINISLLLSHFSPASVAIIYQDYNKPSGLWK